MKKVLLGLGFLLVALVIGLVVKPPVGVVRATVIDDGCGYECKDVEWSAKRLVCDDGWTLIDWLGGKKCYKKWHELKTPTEQTFGPITINYEKWDRDPHKCHRETAESLNVPSWARSKFNTDNPEFKYGDRFVPEGKYLGEDNMCHEKTPVCTDPEATNYDNDVDETEYSSQDACKYPEEPTDVCPNIEGDQTEVPEGYELEEGQCVEKEEPPCEECGGGGDEEEPKEEPKQEVTSSSNSSPAPSIPTAPQCSATPVVKEAANPHVYRNGDTAIVKWFPSEGGNAHIYYKEHGAGAWQHSVRDISNSGYFEIKGLGSKDWDFAVQQANGCAAGPMSAVIEDGNGKWVLFTPTKGLYLN